MIKLGNPCKLELRVSSMCFTPGQTHWKRNKIVSPGKASVGVTLNQGLSKVRLSWTGVRVTSS